MAEIHPTAIVASGAVLGEGVRIGPYCVVGEKVVIGRNARLISHVVVEGETEIGEDCAFYPFASLGQPPQIPSYSEALGRIRVGAGSEFREHVTVHPGTPKGGGITSIGARNLLMIGSHVAHDCHLGDDVVFANHTILGGHCVIGDHVMSGGTVVVKQFTRIGAHGFICGKTGVTKDIPPFALVNGWPDRVVGVNRVGLKRRGFSHERIMVLRKAFKCLFDGDGLMSARLAEAADRFASSPDVMALVAFLRERR